LETCRLCLSGNTFHFHTDHDTGLSRTFLSCANCGLIFVQQKFLPDKDTEKDRYLSHNNDIDDLDYQAFLSRLWNPMKNRLNKGSSGLDFGAGPGPALMHMMRKEGFKVEIYDPFFAPNTRILVKSFEFIVCTETVEHFHNPSEEFYQLNRMLDNNGFLGIMTSLIDSVSNFGDWYYRRDPTHVSFYSSKTMEWIAKKMNWKIDLIKDNVIIFYKA